MDKLVLVPWSHSYYNIFLIIKSSGCALIRNLFQYASLLYKDLEMRHGHDKLRHVTNLLVLRVVLYASKISQSL